MRAISKMVDCHKEVIIKTTKTVYFNYKVLKQKITNNAMPTMCGTV